MTRVLVCVSLVAHHPEDSMCEKKSENRLLLRQRKVKVMLFSWFHINIKAPGLLTMGHQIWFLAIVQPL